MDDLCVDAVTGNYHRGACCTCYVVTPTLKVLQKVLKCDVTLLSIYNRDWSQKGKFSSCNIITLDV